MFAKALNLIAGTIQQFLRVYQWSLTFDIIDLKSLLVALLILFSKKLALYPISCYAILFGETSVSKA